jgi:hypothetical protein
LDAQDLLAAGSWSSNSTIRLRTGTSASKLALPASRSLAWAASSRRWPS